MALWRDHLLPRIVDKACARRDFAEPRRRTLAGVSGDVVEIGFGSGHNVAYYPSEVDRVLAVEPSAVARRLAEPRVAGSGMSVEPPKATRSAPYLPVQPTWRICAAFTS